MGQVAFRWEKTSEQRQTNEAHDTAIFALAAGIKFGVNWISDQGWQKLRDELEGAGPPPGAGGREVRLVDGARTLAEQLAR